MGLMTRVQRVLGGGVNENFFKLCDGYIIL